MRGLWVRFSNIVCYTDLLNKRDGEWTSGLRNGSCYLVFFASLSLTTASNQKQKDHICKTKTRVWQRTCQSFDPEAGCKSSHRGLSLPTPRVQTAHSEAHLTTYWQQGRLWTGDILGIQGSRTPGYPQADLQQVSRGALMATAAGAAPGFALRGCALP